MFCFLLKIFHTFNIFVKEVDSDLSIIEILQTLSLNAIFQNIQKIPNMMTEWFDGLGLFGVIFDFIVNNIDAAHVYALLEPFLNAGISA